MFSVKKPGLEWEHRNEESIKIYKSCHNENRLDRFYIVPIVPGKQMEIKKWKPLKVS